MDKKNDLSVIFICSSLEPGHDGVGDYTRRLAAALIKQGGKCGIVSLNERYLTSTFNGTQQVDDTDVPVMRIAAPIDIKERFALAKNWIDEFNPRWVSLQFVPFGYHPKGLKVGLSRLLMPLGRGRKWHIMLHELWVGIAEEESQKLQLWGKAQRLLIMGLLKNLKPQVLHTQTGLYKTLLAKLGYTVEILPLFGNIPVVKQMEENQALDKIAFVVFGAIHDRAPIDDLSAEAAQYAQKHNVPVTLTIMGRGNSEQQRWADAWANAGLPVELLGKQEPERISEVLSNSTMGVSATALAVIAKSGSYAAMREHGLPVLSVAKPWTPIGVSAPEIPEGVIAYQKGNFEDCIAKSRFIPYSNSVYEVSVKFAQALSQH